MKKIYFILLFLFISSCKVLGDFEKEKKRVQFYEVNKTTETAPGDKVFYAVPQVPKARPKSETVTKTGKNGATLKTKFNNKGEVTETSCECPEIKRQNEILTALLQEEKKKNENISGETKGININIIAIAAMALLFLYIDKRS